MKTSETLMCVCCCLVAMSAPTKKTTLPLVGGVSDAVQNVIAHNRTQKVGD